MPGVSYRNQKPPPGPLKLDLGNSLSIGMQGRWIMNSYGNRIIADRSGNGVNASLVGGPNWGSDVTGANLQVLAASSQYISVPYNPATQVGGGSGANAPFTYYCRFNMNSLRNWNALISQAQGNGADPIDSYVDSTGTLTVYLSNSGGGAGVSTTVSGLLAQTTYALAITHNGISNAVIYLNGVQRGTLAPSAGSVFSGGHKPILFGTRDDHGFFTDGWFDDAGTWNRVLAANEVSRLYYEPFSMFLVRPLKRLYLSSLPIPNKIVQINQAVRRAASY